MDMTSILFSEIQVSVRDIQVPKTRPLPAIEILGCPPPKPPRPPVVSLPGLKGMIPLATTTQSIAATEQNYLSAENQECEDSPNYEATIPFQNPSEDSISPCTDKSPYDIGIEVIAKPRKSFVHQGFSHEHIFGNDKKKSKQSWESELHKKDKDRNPKKITEGEGILRKPQVKEDHRGKKSLLCLKPETNSDKVYENLCSGESSQPQMEMEGKEKFKKLGRLFKKEKEKLKPKKTKKNLSGFSVSMPNLEFKSPDDVFYENVAADKKDLKEKVRLWKPKFLMMKENKGNRIAEEPESFSPRFFFRNKKPNL
ncbi:FYN-binding protein 2 isoform X3 [Notamacropus eugenii]|uniref:FYN-binding protein 2 isoform X3 n=1 Tax=Notamacropus eugenii TaxID=9315 RepID=UPI003B670006